MVAQLAASTMSEGLRLASLLGYAGFFFLAATVLLGMATALDLWSPKISGAALEQVHLAFAVAGLAGIGGHIAAHSMRAVGGIGVWEAFVTFASGGWVVAAGVVGWLVLIVVVVTVPFRAAIGYRGWLRIHRAAYAAAALTALHVVAASDEVGRLAISGIAVIATVVVVLLAARRRMRGTADFHPAPGPTQRIVELEP
jgi:sulfoxide reductase heme-binding subunit YedZ